MTDHDFLDAFEKCAISRADWTHAAHLRIAWTCVCHEDQFDDALNRVRTGIQRLNASFGTSPDKYHETVTVAFMRIVAERIADGPATDSAAAFLASHPDLLSRDEPILHRYYSPALLESRRAHARFVKPDVSPLPEPIPVAR